MNPVSIEDHREAARRSLPRFLFDYIDGGSYAEATMAANAADLRAAALRQRVLRDVSAIDLRTRLFGQDLAMPVILGPVGLAGMYARRGEVQALKGAAAKGVPFALSTVGVCSLSELRRKTRLPFWFQLYMLRDRGFMEDLLAQARDADCPVLVFTVDMPLPGARYRDFRSGLAGSSGPGVAARRFAQALGRMRWAWSVGLFGRPHTLGNVAPVLKGSTGLEDFITWMAANFDPSVTWKDLEWVRARWTRPIVLKGILDPDDARDAIAAGADGIVVSNHGGRQLDGVRSSFSAMAPIMDAVGGRTTVLADGGVRSGLDVLRFLAAGASGVLLGRAWAYALAGGGQSGVEAMLDVVRKELLLGMTLTGCRTVADANASILDDPRRH